MAGAVRPLAGIGLCAFPALLWRGYRTRHTMWGQVHRTDESEQRRPVAAGKANPLGRIFLYKARNRMKRFMERLKRKMKQSDTVSRDGAEIRRDFLYMARGQPRATGS